MSRGRLIIIVPMRVLMIMASRAPTWPTWAPLKYFLKAATSQFIGYPCFISSADKV